MLTVAEGDSIIMPMQAISMVDGVPVHISLRVMMSAMDDVVSIMVTDDHGNIMQQTLQMIRTPRFEPVPESDAEVLRRIAYDLEGPDWSECDE